MKNNYEMDLKTRVSVGYWLGKIALASGAVISAYVACIYRISLLLISALTSVLVIVILEDFVKILRTAK
jgi:hypothetical protein